jgi:hypothetical protein
LCAIRGFSQQIVDVGVEHRRADQENEMTDEIA